MIGFGDSRMVRVGVARHAWWMLAVLLAASGCATGGDTSEVAVATPKVSTDEVLTAAETDIEARRFQMAYQRLARLDQAAFEAPRTKYVSGEILLGLNRPKEALAEYQAVQADPAYGARASQGMGLSLAALNDFTVAKSQLERAVAADPSLWRSWVALGRIADGEKNWTGSEAAYAKALELQPDSAIVANNMGMSLMMQHRYDEAVRTFQHVLELDPTMDMTRANLRIALAWQGQYDQALVGVQPGERADALNNVGYVAMLRGDQETAQKCFSQALEISPTYHDHAARNLETLKLLVKSKASKPLLPSQEAPTVN